MHRDLMQAKEKELLQTTTSYSNKERKGNKNKTNTQHSKAQAAGSVMI